jgi:hypothetical protein
MPDYAGCLLFPILNFLLLLFYALLRKLCVAPEMFRDKFDLVNN